MFRMQVWNCFDRSCIDYVLKRDRSRQTVEQAVKEFILEQRKRKH